MLCFTILCPPSRIPECIQVVFIASTSTKEQLRALAARMPALHVRGKVIVRWAKHLNEAYIKYLGMPSTIPESAVLALYESMDGVPQEILNSAISTETEEEADEMLAAAMHNRAGHNAHAMHHPMPNTSQKLSAQRNSKSCASRTD